MTDRIEMSACTSVMVGKKASLDGATYIYEDRLVAIHPKTRMVQPAVSGRQEIYKSPYNGLTVPLPESGYRYTSTPNADESEGPNEEDGFNEKNVGERSSLTNVFGYSSKTLLGSTGRLGRRFLPLRTIH